MDLILKTVSGEVFYYSFEELEIARIDKQNLNGKLTDFNGNIY